LEIDIAVRIRAAGCGKKLHSVGSGCQVPPHRAGRRDLRLGACNSYGPVMTMRMKLLVFLLFGAASGAHAAAPELVLAGGSLHLCSSLAVSRCSSPTALPEGRGSSRYALDGERRTQAVDPLLWSGREHLLPILERQLDAAAQRLGISPVDEAVLVEALRGGCEDCGAAVWERLLDAERTTVLAALELPQIDDGVRRREHVSLADSREPGGVQVLHAFVAAAARRSAGRPRIALVTASALDSFDPVDYYLDALRQAGGDPYWWPVDAATASIVFGDGDCSALERARRRELGMPGRATIYPDHAATQHGWCGIPGASQLPAATHGVFFTGGDQWRLRRAFFDGHDRPNPWLQSLRDAFDRGELAIGGTSAGTAVQSGADMLSNGTPRHALQHGVRFVPPPPPGCTRAGLCAGVDEDAMTLWPGGGLGLAAPFLLDTHFSERGREWRLLRALAALPQQRWAIGVDETSAIRVERATDGSFILEAIGARGGWMFDIGLRHCGRVAGSANYLAPGVRWRLDESAFDPVDALPSAARVDPASTAQHIAALAPGAARAAAWRLASHDTAAVELLDAGDARLQLQRTRGTRTWQAAGGTSGVSGLEVVMQFTDEACAR
jgi:hypothetical protein